MIGRNIYQDSALQVEYDKQSWYGASSLYSTPTARDYKMVGTNRNLPVLAVSNKTSDHNILNMPLTPVIVVAQLPNLTFPKQFLRNLSLPTVLPGGAKQ